ncbi:glycosyltransferase family 2 protein [Gryllotalpicola reticulitermitis]|uniref:Glycosyltransferase family 2 protein n=1 Tax=Gryllotalpicola reticulitermitis TaxID=1184153 RepID=A0ABV8Q8A6_9MICO
MMSGGGHTAQPVRARFTVVIPTHRRPELLAECLRSIAGQRRRPDEVVVISDGPDSDAAEVARTAAVPVVFRELPQGGVARARNAGIELATGDWVCFLDDDDLYHPDFLAELERYVEAHPDAHAVNAEYWRFANVPGDGIDIVGASVGELLTASVDAVPVTDMSYLHITGRSYELLLHGLRGNLSSTAVRRELLLAAGRFPEGRVCAEDWTMFLNVARYAEWHVVPRRLVFMRTHPGNNTSARPVLNAVHTLEAIRDVWRQSERPTPQHPSIDVYRLDYRFMLRSGLASARRARDWGAYRRLLTVGAELLPRRADRLRAVVASATRRS